MIYFLLEILKFILKILAIGIGIKILFDFIGFIRQEDAKQPKTSKKEWLVIILIWFIIIIAIWIL